MTREPGSTTVAQSAFLYDIIQLLFGNRRLQRRMLAHYARLSSGDRVLDVGGGTGIRLSSAVKYVCLDLDRSKLRRFRDTTGRPALAGDATRCPIRTGAVDAVLCVKVTHHLADADLAATFRELERVTKSGGTLILVDALRTDRWMARLLWAIDRGSHPRTAEALDAALPSGYAVSSKETFRLGIFHDVVVYVATRR